MDQASNLRNIIKSNQVNMQTSKARVITVTSGKGGVGKSNISVNLAINFRRQGKRVVIFDADFGLANVEVIFGVVPKYSLFDLIYQNLGITDVLTSGPFGIDFSSGGTGVQELFNLDNHQIEYMIRQLYKLDTIADIIIIDTGAGISDAVMNFILASNEILLITTPEPTAITDAYAVLKAIKKREGVENLQKKSINLLVNRVENDAEGLEIFKKLNKVTERFLHVKLNNIGFLPNDKSLEKAVIEQNRLQFYFLSQMLQKHLKK